MASEDLISRKQQQRHRIAVTSSQQSTSKTHPHASATPNPQDDTDNVADSFEGSGDDSASTWFSDDVNIAPALNILGCCGLCPCCCCLYSNIDAGADESTQGSYIDQENSTLDGSKSTLKTKDTFNTTDDENHYTCDKTKKLNVFYINRNVLYLLLVVFLTNIGHGSSIESSIFSAYIFTLSGGKNKYIGYIESISAASLLMATLLLSRKNANGEGVQGEGGNKSRLIRLGGMITTLFVIGGVSLIFRVGFNSDLQVDGDMKSFAFIFGIALTVLWGAAQSIIDVPAMSLYILSSPSDYQGWYRDILESVRFFSSAMGPLVSIIVLAIWGDEWNTRTLGIALFVGLIAQAGAGFWMFWFDDDRAFYETLPSDNLTSISPPSNELSPIDTSQHISKGKPDVSSPLTLDRTGCGEVDDLEYESGADSLDTPDSLITPAMHNLGKNNAFITTDNFSRSRGLFVVPFLITLQSIIMSVGSGFTIKYFPLFFHEELGVTPIVVQSIFVVTPFVMLFMKKLAVCFVHIFGTPGVGNGLGVILIFKTLGVMGLYFIAYHDDLFGECSDDNKSQCNSSHQLIPIYIFRTAFINGTFHLEDLILEKSVLISDLNSTNTGTNNGESSTAKSKASLYNWRMIGIMLSRLGWAISAAIGGIMVDNYDYSYTFKITAWIQTIGLGLLVCLSPFVKRVDVLKNFYNGVEDRDEYYSDEFQDDQLNQNDRDDHQIQPLNEPLLDAGHDSDASPSKREQKSFFFSPDTV